MKVLITGGRGQLGMDLERILSNFYEVFAFGRDNLDVTDQEQVIKQIEKLRPDVVIHCAAYTAVDQAETDAKQAYQVNAEGTRNVVLAAEKIGAKICYISTDYVFDGQGEKPYKEYDAARPLTVYGRSKLAGEQWVRDLSTKFFIVRTSWVFGKHGRNFVKTILQRGREKGRLTVVMDQFGSPTYTVDLASFLCQLIATGKYGIYHASNTGFCSWYEFAKEIIRISGIPTEIIPCTTDEYPRPARRPAYSVLDHEAIRRNGFREFPPWQEALRRFLQEIGEI